MERIEDYKESELIGLSPCLFLRNRQNYFQNLKKMLLGLDLNSIVVLQGGDDIPRYDSDSNYYLFEQEANFYYLPGVKERNCYLLLDLRVEQAYVYITLPKSERDIIFLNFPSLQELSEKYQIQFKDMDNFYNDLMQRDPDKIYVLSGVNCDSQANLKSAEFDFPESAKKYSSRIDKNVLIYEILADTRTRKTDEEIGFLTHLFKATVEGHIKAIKSVKSGINERDVQNIFYNYMSSNYYARNWGHEPIIGSGMNSATLFYGDINKPLVDGGFILMDLGVKIAGYCSDVCSTIPVNGKFTERQRDIYEVVLSASRRVINSLKTGVYFPAMHLEAEREILKGLKALNILNNYEIDEMIEKRIAYYFFPHGLGHFIGLDAHDVGGYLSFTPPIIELPGLSALKTARCLVPGNIVTIEPGIYFIKNLLEMALSNE